MIPRRNDSIESEKTVETLFRWLQVKKTETIRRQSTIARLLGYATGSVNQKQLRQNE